MALERNLSAVPPVLLTADGSTEGVVTVANTCGFYVKQQVVLQAPLILPLNVEIKRVVSPTVLWVGIPGPKMTHNIDVSAYTVAAGSFIYAVEQPKSAISMEARMLASYMQEPSNSWRASLVDCIGNLYDNDNPFPVAFDGTISIGDVHIIGPSPSNNELNVNSDGSINVNVVSTPPVGNAVVSTYGEANSVVSGSTVTVVSYTVPGGLTSAILERISVSGENIAKFTVFINATHIDTRRTFYGSSLSEYFEFTTGTSNGLEMNPGDTVTVKVLHNKPYVADFEGRIQVLQIA